MSLSASSGRREAAARLAAVIERAGGPGEAFEPALLDWLRMHVRFDHCVVFGYRGSARPPMLFETFSPSESHVFVALYQEGPYLLDPFHHAAVAEREGFWRMRELAPDRFYASEYYRSYYSQTGLAEEVGFFVPLGQGSAVVLSLMRLRRSGPFGTADVRLLRDIAPLVLCLCRRHWRGLTLGPAPVHADLVAGATPAGRDVDRARIWASLSLTPREEEVVNLVLQGHSTESISRALRVAVGTVRVHRRNIHRKLDVRSQAGLFARFIALLDTRSAP